MFSIKIWNRKPSLADRIAPYTYPTVNTVTLSDTESMQVKATFMPITRRNIRNLLSR